MQSRNFVTNVAQKMSKEFTGVFIPAHIWDCKDLIPAEKMLLGEVAALSVRTGWCTASREHFAEWLQCTPANVSYYTKKLANMGFLEIAHNPGYNSKMRVVTDRFYVGGVVNGTEGGSKSHLRGVVNGTEGGSKWGLPEIQYKDNKEIKDKESKRAQSFFANVEADKEQAPPIAPPPPAQGVHNLQEAIQAAESWANNNPEQVRYWMETARITGWDEGRTRQEIASYFSYYYRTTESDRHICRRDPSRFFRDGFLGWLMKCDKGAAKKTQQGANVNAAPPPQEKKKQPF